MTYIYYLIFLISLSSHLLRAESEDFLSWPLEKKIGQLMLVHFYGETLNDELKELIEKCYIGGVIFYDWANDFKSPEELYLCSSSIQQFAHSHHLPSLFIAVDHEGGHVVRLFHGFTSFPSQYALGLVNNYLFSESYNHLAKELRACGINLNFAPVVDIHSNPLNPVIGMRSFGSSKEKVVACAKQALKSFKDYNLISCIKHFPGHGDTTIDSHLGLPYVSKSLDQLEALELFPFAACINKAPMIMTSHLMLTQIDPLYPTTFSQTIIENLLRNRLNYKGVVITDSLVMSGILSKCSGVKEAAILALNAGHDFLLLGGKQLVGEHKGFELTSKDLIKLHHELVSAVNHHIISMERIDDALRRVLQLKDHYLKTDITQEPFSGTWPSNRFTSQKIANIALLTEKHDASYTLDSSKPTLIIAPLMTQKILELSNFMTLFPKKNIIYLSPDISVSEYQTLLSPLIQSNKNIVWITWNQSLSNDHQMLYQTSIKSHPHIAIALNNPEDAKLLTASSITFITHGAASCSLDAVTKQLSAWSY